MGVYINMEMPTEGYIDVRIKCNGTASFAIADNPYIKAVEAVPVPPHGRLIDANALAEHKFVCIPHVSINGKDAGTAYRLGWNTAIEAVMENAETIIGGE